MRSPEKKPKLVNKTTLAAAAGSVTAMNLITTVFLHRSESHGSLRLHPKLRFMARAGTWLLSGMKPREWVGVHAGKHHPAADEATDPHSPVQNGRFGVLKVLFTNVSMYKKAARNLEPGDYPDRLKPDALDKAVFDKAMLGQLALFGIFTAVHKAASKDKLVPSMVRAGVTLGLHDLVFVAGGGVINGFGHAGRKPLYRALLSPPEPYDDGTYAKNLNVPLTLTTVGEGSHRNHHEDPRRLVFNDNPLLDPGGLLALGLIKAGLAEKGLTPPQKPQSAVGNE